MSPREQILLEQRQRIIKHSDKKFWVKFERVINAEVLSFKVWIDCSSWSRDSTDIPGMATLISNLYAEDIPTLNNDNYHLLVDSIYDKLATVYPDKNIWIELNNDNFGLLAKYETRTPSTLLKI